MKTISLAIIGIAGFIGSTTAFAGDNGWYALAGVGQTINNDDKSTLDSALTAAGASGFSSSLSNPTVYKLQVGYQVNKNLAFEGGYLGSNDETYTATGGNIISGVTASANIKGYNLSAVGIFPVSEQFSLLAKLGVANIKESATLSGGGGSISADGTKTDVTYGIGAQYDFTKQVFGRFDIDSYNVGSSNSASRSSVWVIDVGFHF